MKEIIVKRLGALLSVKSLVTLLLSGVFAYLAITGQTSQEFMTVYTVVIAFYFGTQTQKISDAVEKRSSCECDSELILRYIAPRTSVPNP